MSEEFLERHFSGELPYYNSEYRMRHKDGHWVWIHDSGKIVTHTIDGKPLMMYGTHIDITQRILVEETLARVAKRDHHIAEIFQQTAMPRHIPILPTSYEIGTRYQPALLEADVCGDFYDIFDLGDGNIGICIGDIEGKGLLAALRITAARNMIRSYAFLYDNPSKVMSLVNEALCRDIAMESDMLTAFYAVLDTHNHILTYSNAGHEPPLMRHSSGTVEPLKCGGSMFCGMSRQDYTECRVFLQPGDFFVMVTDGITEASMDRGSDQFGTEGIIRCLTTNASASSELIATAILEDATNFADGSLHDDAAIIVIKRVSDQ
jgi:sigma-B regulation protein RsbU (phosphoserine phosphatase)